MDFLRSILENIATAGVVFALGFLATVILFRFTARNLADADLEQYMLAEIAKACGRDRQFVWEFVVKNDFRFFNRFTIVYVGYSKDFMLPRYDRRHVIFFDVSPPTFLDKLISRPSGYRISSTFEFTIPDWAHASEFFIPTGHRKVDVNNDGRDELILDFTCTFADRLSEFFGIFCATDNSWEYIGSPDLRPFLANSEQTRGLALYQEKYEMQLGSSTGSVLAYSNGSFYSFGKPSADQGYKVFIGVASNQGEATLSPHKFLFLMLCYRESQFILEENWNHGTPWLMDQARHSISEAELNEIIAQGYQRQKIGTVTFYRGPLFGKLKDLRQD
ncbi:MAG: hypothetical protein ACLQMO_11900 [Acidobacteriaceae bacterium]